MQLNHPAKDYLSDADVDSLLLLADGSILQKFNTFCSRLEALALTRYGGPDEEDAKNKFKGDLFELFVEFLIKYKGTCNTVGICDYQTSNEAKITDYGVDGIGKSTVNSKMATVQAKYRQENYTIHWNDGSFGNFRGESYELIMAKDPTQFPTDNTQMLYITSAGDVHYSIHDISRMKIRVIDRMGLRELCDNMTEFWVQFRESILGSHIRSGQITSRLILRQHQLDAVDEVIADIRDKDGKGRVILPTGTGKTLIQAQIIVDAHKKLGHITFAIFSPRILLAFQHLVNISDHLISNGIDAEYLNVNSGNFDERIINEERRRLNMPAERVPSTTSSEEIGRAYRRAKERGKILVISSTYHSAERIRSAEIPIDLQLNDEAHNMVSEEFTVCHGIGHNCFYFTATEKYTDSDVGLGMNNEVLWGNTVFEKLPKEMIDVGEMLPPVLHIVETSQRQIEDNDYNSIFSAISESFFEHRRRLHSISANPTIIGPKLLVTMEGQRTLRGILGEKGALGCITFETFRKQYPNISIFSISSDLGAYVNGQWLAPGTNTKDELLQQVRHLSDNAEAIVLYVDMLTEGIDVPGITAFMPFRGMGESAFTQGVGRSTRLHHLDRIRFYNGEIGTADADATNYIKPSAEIIIPTVLVNTRDTAAQYVRLWQSLYGSFGEREHVVFSSYQGIDIGSSLTDLSNVDRQFQISDSGIDTFLHRIIGRPDKLDIDKLWFVAAIRAKCDETLIRQLYERIGFHAHLDMYKSIANWQERDNIKINDLISQMRNSGQSVFTDEVKKKFGTIYTPEFVVQKTVDLAWKYIPTDADKLQLTYCDPAAGDGNFLDYVYHKLMQETSISDPVQRSYHILMHCLYGFEILEPMVYACKIRLMLLHKKVLDEHGRDGSGLLDLMDKLHIYHGNTICLPADTEQPWYSARQNDEGGLLPEGLREKRFDVIVGNPPYTHLRNLGNRRYAAYPKQRDLAQVFVRWALDHLTEKGVIGFNIADSFLNYKLSDGAKDTRLLIDTKIRAIAYSTEIEQYSKGDGGNLPTAVVVIGGGAGGRSIAIDSDVVEYTNHQLLNDSRFIEHLINSDDVQFISKKASEIIAIRGIRVNVPAEKTTRNKVFRELMVDDTNDGDYHIIFKCIYGQGTVKPAFKLVRHENIDEYITNNFHSEIKIVTLAHKQLAVCLFGYFNSLVFEGYLCRHSKRGAENRVWVLQLAANTFAHIPVPDFDFYKQDRSERFAAYMSWIEANMRDKDAFLAGIDEQFEKLIG